MAAHTGESAQRTGDLRWDKCHDKDHVRRGEEIARCPNCASDSCDSRVNEPGNR